MEITSQVYKPRDPGTTALYEVVRDILETLYGAIGVLDSFLMRGLVRRLWLRLRYHRLWSHLRYLGRPSVNLNGRRVGPGDVVWFGHGTKVGEGVVAHGPLTRIERDGSFWCQTDEGLVHLGSMHDGTWVERRDSRNNKPLAPGRLTGFNAQ